MAVSMSTPNTITSEQQKRVYEWIATLAGMEETLGRALESQVAAAAADDEVRAAIDRWREAALQHGAALRLHLEQIGGADTPPDSAIVARLAGLVAPPYEQVAGLGLSSLLWNNYAAFHQLFMGYGMLLGIGQRASDAFAARLKEQATGAAATSRLGTTHMRHHATAASEIVVLAPDTLLRELRQKSDICVCACRTCRQLGSCVCIKFMKQHLVDDLAETAVPEETVVHVRELQPNGAAARAGLRVGDAMVTAEDQRVPEASLNGILAALDTGSPVRLGVRRAGQPEEAVEEVLVAP